MLFGGQSAMFGYPEQDLPLTSTEYKPMRYYTLLLVTR